MADEDRIEIKFPKGIKSKDLAIIVIFGIVISLMLWTLQNVFTSGFQNTNYAIIVIAFILVAICFIVVYVIRAVSKEEKPIGESNNQRRVFCFQCVCGKTGFEPLSSSGIVNI